MKNFSLYALLTLLSGLVSFSSKSQVTSGFTPVYTSGCSPLVDSFSNTSTGPVTGYFWDFGTGITSVVKNPSASFTSPGTYIVKLTVFGPGGPVTSTQTVTVYPPPAVSFYASVTTVCPGDPVTFTSTTVGGAPGPVTYTWSFGDGTLSTATSPVHIYSTSGYYNVTLYATSSAGCTKFLTVAKYIHVTVPPVPNFTVNSNYVCITPGTVTFTDSSVGVPPLTYSWDFGDGSGPSTLKNPPHTYTAAGTYTIKLTVTDGNGCTATITKPAFVTIANTFASFTYPTPVCTNSIVTFLNTSSTHTYSHWSYGDGDTSSGDPGIHQYASPGIYVVKLLVFDGTCLDSTTKTITVIPGPAVSFTQVPIEPCPPPVGIKFIATTPPGSTLRWTFGIGGPGTGSPVTHTFPFPGVYTITLYATDPTTGCVSNAVRTDTLYDMIHGITASPVMGCAPLTVNFYDTPYTYQPAPPPPLPPILHLYPFSMASYSWTFGDGGTSTLSRPSHTYTAAGVYLSSVTVVSSNGCVYTDTLTIFVGGPPVVTFTAAPTHVCYGQPVTYVATLIKGPIDAYSWRFGDGGGGSGSTITYTDTLPGIFTVTLTPYYRGCPGPPVTFSGIIVDSPRSIIRYTVICSPRKRVQFWDKSLGDDSHLWIFGDGTTSTLSNPLHDYPLPVTYTVQLATYNKTSGCRDTDKVYIDLSTPTPDFTVSSPFICKDAVDTFTATMTGGIAYGYYWDSGGGTFACYAFPPSPPPYGGPHGRCGPVITDTFHVPGIYTIRLIVSDQNRCTDTVVKPNIINVGHPKVKFSASPPIGCWPLTVTFIDSSSDMTGFKLSKYLWSFGDGSSTTVTTTSVAHTFTIAGTFKTQEIVIDNYGCTDSLTLPLVTVWRPHAAFSANQYPCLGDTVHFVNSSTDTTGTFWTFGDGATSTATAPSHIYTTTGSFTVTLAVRDIHGCVDTAVYVNYILSTNVVASFTMSDSFSICPPLIVNFTNTGTGGTNHNWDLGDGNVSALPNPVNMYMDTGYFTVILIDSNKYGCKDTSVHHVYVLGYAGALSYAPLSGCVPLTVHFKATVSNVPSIIWDFSDGIISKAILTDSIDHIYLTPGAYVPKLILSDNTGCSNFSIGKDTIKVDNVFPGFTSIPNPICINVPVYYKDTSHSLFSTVNSWLWKFTNGDTSTSSSLPYLYAVAGTYPVSLKVTDQWGCVDSVTGDVVVYPQPVITASPDTIVCLTDAATLTGYGGVSYSWAPTSTVSCINCNPALASPRVVTTYTVTGTDIHGCVNTNTVTVFLKTKTVSYASSDTGICANSAVQLLDSGGTTYLWSPSGGVSNVHIADPLVSPASTTQYMVIAKLGSCIADTAFVLVTVHPLPTVEVGPDQTVVEGNLTHLIANGTWIEKYSWGKSPALSCDTCPNPVATNSVTATYIVVVTSAFGCNASDSVTVRVHCDKSQIFMPNSFTPNGDGQNDTYYPRGKGVMIVKSFRIYNRWGQLLFERSNFQVNDAANAWDGSYMGGDPRPDVFVWVVDAVCETGEPINLKGDVTIIR